MNLLTLLPKDQKRPPAREAAQLREMDLLEEGPPWISLDMSVLPSVQILRYSAKDLGLCLSLNGTGAVLSCKHAPKGFAEFGSHELRQNPEARHGELPADVQDPGYFQCKG